MAHTAAEPSLQRAKLTASERAYMQGRVESLHRMLAASSNNGQWMDRRGTEAEGLATVEGSLLLTPPAGLEVSRSKRRRRVYRYRDGILTKYFSTSTTRLAHNA